MKALKRQRALIPCVILLGFMHAGAVRADATSFKVPLTGAQCVPPVDTTGSGTANLTYDPINASGADAYPITSPTYIITYAKYSDAGKVALLKAFIGFILGTDGQADANKTNFAPLPSSLDQMAVAQLAQLST